MFEKGEATYQYREEMHGRGMFFFTDCCRNRMYSVDSDPMKYHGCLCPKCFLENKFVTLYLRGTPEGIRVAEKHLKEVFDFRYAYCPLCGIEMEIEK